MVSGAAILALTLAWLRGFQLRSRFRKYQAVFEFSQACGICVGTPVRIRGVTVGNVVRVDSSLKSIDATVEVCFSPISLECSSNYVLNVAHYYYCHVALASVAHNFCCVFLSELLTTLYFCLVYSNF